MESLVETQQHQHTSPVQNNPSVGMMGAPVESLPSMGGLHVSGQGSNYGRLGDSGQGEQNSSYDPYDGLQNSDGGNRGYTAPMVNSDMGRQNLQQQPLFSGLGMSGAPRQNLSQQSNQFGRSNASSSAGTLDMFAGLSGIPQSQQTMQQPQQAKPRASTSSSMSAFDFM